MRAAGVVLAGGRSSRMGSPKAALEWHGSTLLGRTVRVVGRAVGGPVVVVRAPGQQLPPLPTSGPFPVLVRDDPEEGRGPLQGLAVGLAAAGTEPPDAEVAFVCSTDLPFLHTAFVRAVLDAFEPDRPDVVLPVVHGYRQPLAAGYRTDLAARVQKLLETGRSRPAHLFEECRVRQLTESDLLSDRRLAQVDPRLASAVNVNDPDEYRAARAEEPPEVVVECFGVLARRTGGRGPRRLRAATVGAAARLVGLELDGHVVAAVNGDQVQADDEAPLLAGDSVTFLSADAGG